MKLDVSSITIPKPTEPPDLEQIKGIADSFKEIGQSHPIIVRPANGSSSTYILVSGEKRLMAAKDLGWKEIEGEVRDVTEQAGKIIHLHENLKRFNLPWHEQVVLVEQLHSLRQSEHGVAKPGRPERGVEKEGWSVRDTADELQMGIGNLSEDLSLARALQSNRQLAKVEDKKTAIKLIKAAATRHLAELEATAPRGDDLANQVLFGDATEVLKQIPDQSIHHCITDPPWIKYYDRSLALDDRTAPVFREIYRVLKYNSFLYVVGGFDDFRYYAGYTEPNPEDPSGEPRHHNGLLQRLGFTVANTPIIWQKVSSLTRGGVRAWEYDRDFEFIIVAVKGSPSLVSSTRLSGVKAFKIVHTSAQIHPHEKPIELLDNLVSDCSYEGQLILDPFAGSGVLASACKRLGRKYLLIERDKTTYDNIVKRLEGKK